MSGVHGTVPILPRKAKITCLQCVDFTTCRCPKNNFPALGSRPMGDSDICDEFEVDYEEHPDWVRIDRGLM